MTALEAARTQPVSIDLSIGGRPARLHAVDTGRVTITRSHRRSSFPAWLPYPLRMARISLDRRFTRPMPIWAFVLEHPDGRVHLIDAGGDADFADPSSWAADPVGGRISNGFLRIDTRPSESLPAQMRLLGLDPSDVSTLTLTHQHVDHTGTVPAFASATLITTRAEDRAARMIGSVHGRWRPADMTVRYVDVEGTAGTLGPELDVTDDGSLVAVHTPGHTPGSVTIRLRTDSGTLHFTGDTSFTACDMHPDAPTAGIHTSMRQVRAVQRLLADQTVFPSHDPDVGHRLVEHGSIASS